MDELNAAEDILSRSVKMRNVEPNFTNLLPSQPAHQTKTAWYVSMTVTDVWILAVSIVLAILLSPRDVVPWKLDSFIDTL